MMILYETLGQLLWIGNITLTFYTTKVAVYPFEDDYDTVREHDLKI